VAAILICRGFAGLRTRLDGDRDRTVSVHPVVHTGQRHDFSHARSRELRHTVVIIGIIIGVELDFLCLGAASLGSITTSHAGEGTVCDITISTRVST